MAINFTDEGYERVEFQEHPDVGVISICSVTENVVKSFG
jgi:threonylcarbamoyladenosine tRNA methylthiotransferase MtaB